MKFDPLTLYPYQIPLTSGQKRAGVLVKLGESAWGDVAPLPKWSKETLEEALEELCRKKDAILAMEWMAHEYLEQLKSLKLLPSVHFGIESALLSLLDPLPEYSVPVSALLMGSPEEILAQGKKRHSEGYASAKLKVSNLSFDEAAHVIRELKDLFYLRIDVNCAWSTEESLRFFEQFPQDAFDYVEEPFQNPHDLKLFTHPLAVDESFPQDLTLEELEGMPVLKALIYKPTIQGGMAGCIPLQKWAEKRGVSVVLSSSFESGVGLAHIAGMARRLGLQAPVGIGTYHYLGRFLCEPPSYWWSGDFL
jgi:o-succinylbenzoate synthase